MITPFARRVAAAIFAIPPIALAAPCLATSVQAQAPRPRAGMSSGDIAAMAKARADSARFPYTAADIQFMSGMIGHHTQAIAMSNMAPTHGASPSVQRLAERIINAQQDEIVTMQMWLRDRNQPVPDGKSTSMKMNMNGMEHSMLMPGMLTPEQMQQLDAARGADFDRLFLTFMMQHHRGAVSRVKDLFNSYGAAQDETVFKFANDVNVDQSTESARMELMLAALPPEKRAP